MLLFSVLLSVLLINQVRTDSESSKGHFKEKYSDLENNEIDLNGFCNDKPCIVKCCNDGEVLNYNGICSEASKFKKFFHNMNYSISLYSWNEASRELMETKKKVNTDLVFVRNEKFSNENTNELFLVEFRIVEDGALKIKPDNYTESWIDVSPLEYCVDYRLYATTNIERKLTFVFKLLRDRQSEMEAITKSKFVATGMLTSSFFLLLVLIVYCLLPQLRCFVGLLLMAYVFSLMVAYILKAAQLLVLSAAMIDVEGCKLLSPVLYFFIMSSFTWLNIMCYDLWWTIRNSRKCLTNEGRQYNRMKLLWSCLYGWGIPLLMTIATVVIDRMELYKVWSIKKPPFDSCFANASEVKLYMHLPIAIMTITNSVFFFMTASTIWMIRHNVDNTADCKNITNNKYRFLIYVKLYIVMGVSWILELIHNVPMVVFFVINAFNVYIGIIIFFIFVFKKTILFKLCHRFHINNKFINKFQPSQLSRSGTMRSTASVTFHKSLKREDCHKEDKNTYEMTSVV